MFGKRVIDIVPEADEAENRQNCERNDRRMGLQIDQAETLRWRTCLAPNCREPGGRFRRRTHPVARSQDHRGGALNHAAPSDARLNFHPTAVRDARLHLPHLDLAVAHDIEASLIAIPPWNAVAVNRQPAAGEFDPDPEAHGHMGVRNVPKRDPTLPVRLALSTWFTRWTRPGDRPRRQVQLPGQRHADREPGQRLLGHVGPRSTAPSSMMNSGSP